MTFTDTIPLAELLRAITSGPLLRCLLFHWWSSIEFLQKGLPTLGLQCALDHHVNAESSKGDDAPVPIHRVSRSIDKCILKCKINYQPMSVDLIMPLCVVAILLSTWDSWALNLNQVRRGQITRPSLSIFIENTITEVKSLIIQVHIHLKEWPDLPLCSWIVSLNGEAMEWSKGISQSRQTDYIQAAQLSHQE